MKHDLLPARTATAVGGLRSHLAAKPPIRRARSDGASSEDTPWDEEVADGGRELAKLVAR
jgi:hypothetical protein